ncbi:MAG: hypothetical protein C0621_05555 [Desulfuromonas sp.]|nr:MAG: hypothetical protein C0621_05555 [Desulfuromonas sp.]
MTSSPVDPSALAEARRSHFVALFTALAVGLHAVDVLLPSPLPWFRLGLANILTLVALFLYGDRAAWTVTLGRIGIGSLLLGRLFSPGFFLSFSGGVCAVMLMCGVRRFFPRLFGPIGISLLGAVGHVSGQLLIAWLLLVRHPDLWRLYPWLLLAALVSGLLNGFVADRVLEILRRHPAFAEEQG